MCLNFFFLFLFKERLKKDFKEPVTKGIIPWVEGMISIDLGSALRIHIDLTPNGYRTALDLSFLKSKSRLAKTGYRE